MNISKSLPGRPKERYIHLEVMRIAAVFFVIFNHTGNAGFFLFSQRPADSVQFWIYLFISVFCKFSVPLFLAVSGALMLNRPDEPLRKIWFGRIFKVLIILIVYSLGYYISDMYSSRGVISWENAVVKFYSSYVKIHLWYLYLYIGFLAAVPFLKSLVKNLDDKYFYYMFVIAVFFNGILPVAEYLATQGKITLNGELKMSWLLNNVVLYPCLGFFMQHRMDLETFKKKIPFLWLLNAAGILVSCYMTYYKGQVTGVLSEAESQFFHGSFSVINCVSVFITIRYLFEGRELSSVKRDIILSVGSCTFGIYLWHVRVMSSRLFANIWAILLGIKLNRMAVVFVYCLLVAIVSYFITFVLSKIPILKKLVGF